MLSVLADGLSVLNTYKQAIFAFFITVFGVGFFSTSVIVNREVDVKIRILASIGVGAILLSVISFIFIVFSHFFGFPLQLGGYVILLFAILVLLKGFLSGEFKGIYTLRAFAMAAALLFLLLARLAFLKNILLPSYSDSPVHYQIVYDFLHPEAGSVSNLSLRTIFSNYYHFGFHSLVVWLTSITEFEPVGMISLVGQLLLVIAPISISFLNYTLTYDSNGAMFSGLLTAVGWLMPAFAVNWGKFPALGAMAMLPVVASLPLMLRDHRFERTKVILGGLIFLPAIAFVHTRIVICWLLIFVSFLVIKKLQLKEEFGFFQAVRFTLLFAISLWPLSHPLIDFYSTTPILIALLILTPFAFQVYPAAATGIFVFLSSVSLVTLVPNLITAGNQALLDRQFLAIMLYLPLSLMGGLGFGGLIKKLGARFIMKWTVGIAFVGYVVANMTPLSFYPDSCCTYFKANDRLAFEWIQKNASPHTLYFISSVDDNSKIIGTDAGIWISPLMKISTNKLPFNTQWNSADVANDFCASGLKAAYIYVGGRESSFDNDQLSQLAWLTPVFRDGEVMIYKISGCTQ